MWRFVVSSPCSGAYGQTIHPPKFVAVILAWFSGGCAVKLSPCLGKSCWLVSPVKSMRPCVKNWSSCWKKTASTARCSIGIHLTGGFYDQYHPLNQTPVTLNLADQKFMDGLNQLARTLLKNKFLSPEFLFLSRTESGMCSLLHTLKARVATSQIARGWMPPVSKMKK
jgi:hypothetical protein